MCLADTNLIFMPGKKTSVSFAAVAVDAVIFTIKDNELNILLIKAKKDSPFPNRWVLPGGLVRPEESLDQAVGRHLLSKAGLKNVFFEQLYTFGDVGRDPRNRVVSTAYMILVPYGTFEPKTNEAYSAIQWFSVYELPRLGYDHNKIADAAAERLKAKLTYTNIVYSLMLDEFTLGDLQKTYEIILGRKLDKRNFRKKILQTKLLKKISKKTLGDAHRPAQLYSFTKRTPQFIEVI